MLLRRSLLRPSPRVLYRPDAAVTRALAKRSQPTTPQQPAAAAMAGLLLKLFPFKDPPVQVPKRLHVPATELELVHVPVPQRPRA